jgi:hypothetical protein
MFRKGPEPRLGHRRFDERRAGMLRIVLCIVLRIVLRIVLCNLHYAIADRDILHDLRFKYS